ncbi:hypothetical protein VPH35_108313 [Triticum aestivum]
MAREKVAKWIRKRTMSRKSAGRHRSKESGASELILPRETAPESWISASRAPRKAAGNVPRRHNPLSNNNDAAVSGSGNGAGALPAHSKSRVSAFLSMLIRWRPRVNVLAVLCEQMVYHLMWVVESVVLVGRLCFFLMRFGFKQL